MIGLIGRLPVQKHEHHIRLFHPSPKVFFHPSLKVFFLLFLQVPLDVIWLKIYDGWKASPEEEVAGVSWAMFEDGMGDVDHEDCFDVEPFWAVAEEESLVAAIDHVSREKHQFLVDVGAVVVLSQQFEVAFAHSFFISLEYLPPCSEHPSHVFFSRDELFQFLIAQCHIAQKLDE